MKPSPVESRTGKTIARQCLQTLEVGSKHQVSEIVLGRRLFRHSGPWIGDWHWGKGGSQGTEGLDRGGLQPWYILLVVAVAYNGAGGDGALVVARGPIRG